MKTRLLSPGIITLVLTLAAGIWMIIAPAALNTQPRGAHWTHATINDVVVGGVLIAASLIGIALHLGLGLRALIQAAELEASEADSTAATA